MKLKDLTGMVFGRLTVIKHHGTNEKGVHLWECKCECGNTFIARGDALRYGFTKSCGCLAHETRVKTGQKSKGRQSPRFEDLTGQTFHYLTVLYRTESVRGTKWHCRCICGRETDVMAPKLKSGRTISCGCMGLKHATEAKIKHGDALYRKTERLYNIWAAIKRRCYNPNVDAYKYYGGKGVVMCDEWKNYKNFKAWALGNGYQSGLTIDRIDSNGNYCPDNCQWITFSENRARAKRIPADIEEKAIEMLKLGKPNKFVIQELGISSPTVNRIKTKLGLARKRKNP